MLLSGTYRNKRNFDIVNSMNDFTVSRNKLTRISIAMGR